MDSYQRHLKAWRVLQPLVRMLVTPLFHLSHENLRVDGPVLLVPNHTNAWDPLLVSTSLKEKQVYYVASEHLFRLGFVSKIIDWAVAPIPRRKASVGTDTVKACLRHLKQGHSICLFAEGEQCWDGITGPVFPATGKLARPAGRHW